MVAEAWHRADHPAPQVSQKPSPFDEGRYRMRNVIERTFYRLKDFRRIVTRHDKIAKTFLGTICIITTLIWRFS